MPIEHTDTGATIITGDSIDLYRILAMKHRLGLEVKGLRFKINTAPHVRKLIGSKTRSKAKLLEEFEAWIEENHPVPMVD